MPSAVTITPRLIHKEDLATTTTVPPETETVPVLGLGDAELTKLDCVFLSDLVQAASDSLAASAGVALGVVYYNTAIGAMKARLT